MNPVLEFLEFRSDIFDELHHGVRVFLPDLLELRSSIIDHCPQLGLVGGDGLAHHIG